MTPQIKHELKIGDTQIGILTGVAFAIFYTLLALPIARVAERRHRPAIIAASIIAWSVMTMLCGLAQNFVQLALARVGVGIGEAGSTPASQSLLADYFPPERRATAASIFSMGMPVGVFCGAVMGGWLGQTMGWRLSIIIAGLPGVLLTILVALTLRETRSGIRATSAVAQAPTFFAVLRRLAGRRPLVHLYLGASMLSLTAYSLISFMVLFLTRNHGLSLVHASMGFGIIHGVSAVAGMFAGGVLADRASRISPRFYAWIPAFAAFLSIPLLLSGLNAVSLGWTATCFAGLAFLQYAYIGPTLGVILNDFEPRMRATAVAIFYFALNLIGLGIGPTLTGWLSDRFAASHLPADASYQKLCVVTQSLDSLCSTAAMDGLRSALMCLTIFYGAAAGHFLLAGRAMPRGQSVHD